jgi:SAM-dependent methyltransferase
MLDPRVRILELTGSYWTLATLATALEAGLLEHLREPVTAAEIAARCTAPERVVGRMLDLLVAGDLIERDGERYRGTALVEFLSSPAGASVRSDLASTILQATALFEDGCRKALTQGWQFTDPRILQAQGAGSSAFGEIFVNKIAPNLDGLAERLRDGGRLLDVGAGVGQIAIELARRLPTVTVVGLEPADAPLALARANVAAAGLADRIELRQQLVQDMPDREVFDWAWLPVVFLPDDVLAGAIAVMHRVLRPGGWLMLPATTPATDVRSYVAHLRQELWGGGPRTAEQLSALARDAGFATFREVPGPPGLGVTMLFVQR